MAVDRLRLLGVQVLRVAEPGALLADTYQETSRETGARQDVRGPMAGSDGIVRSQVALVRSAIDVPAGSFYVPLNQTLANLAVAALEPDTQSSYYANRLIERLEDSARIMGTPSLVFEGCNKHNHRAALAAWAALGRYDAGLPNASASARSSTG